MKLILPTLLGLVITVVSGWQHGLLVDRWGVPSDVVKVAEQTESLDLEFEGWKSRDLEKPNDRTRKLAGAEGYFSRQYVHEEPNVAVQVTILCGRPGPISLHSPDYCFVLSGMSQLEAQSKAPPFQPDSADSIEFWMADYRPPESKPSPDIRTFWSWSTDGKKWSIPEDPRFTFASAPYLYRLYFTVQKDVFQPTGSDEETQSQAAIIAQQFMDEFLVRYSEVVANHES